MTQVLRFNGLQIGTYFLRVEPATHALTPPARRIGLFQTAAAINSDSRNILYARLFYVAYKETSNIALDQVIGALQSLIGVTGDLEIGGQEIVEGVPIFTGEMICEGWTVDEVTKPSLPSGFGGRFCGELVITAVGATPPRYGAS